MTLFTPELNNVFTCAHPQKQHLINYYQVSTTTKLTTKLRHTTNASARLFVDVVLHYANVRMRDLFLFVAKHCNREFTLSHR